MQIVSRRTMLALPVERLVGSSTSNNNTNNENNNRRPTMSPDSSGSSSNISDSSSSRSDSPNAKVYSSYMSNNNNNTTTASTKSDNSINKCSPIRSQSSSPTTAASVTPPLTPPAIITSTSDQAEDSTGNSKFPCSCSSNNNAEESSRTSGMNARPVGGYGMTLSSPSSSVQEEIQFKTENNNNRNEDEDDDRKEGNHPEPSATNLPLAVVQSKKIRIIEDSLNKMDNMDSMSCNSSSSGDEIEHNNGRPPSRPPSSASSNFTTASTNTTFPLSPNSDIKPIPMISRPQQHHHHHHHHHHNNGSLQALKFSIEDILRPEFGKSALKTRAPSNNSSRRCSSIVDYNLPDSPSSIRSKESSLSNHRNNDYGQQVSPRQNHHHHHHHRPSSIKDHSEDSNSSCTSRKEEVVDESKVNPPVPAGPLLWPAWVYCTRYSDRPSSGPRSRRIRKKEPKPPGLPREQPEEKRPRTAFTAEQLARLKQEFEENRYLTEKRRQDLARDLKLHENQIKIWFQNKRAKLKKSSGPRGGLAMQLMAQGLYNHSTVPIDEDDEMYEAMMQK